MSIRPQAAMREVVAYTSICEEDRDWIDQYLSEIERLNINFVIHFDRCSEGTKKRLWTHPRCLAQDAQDNPEIEFTEQHKQGVFNQIVSMPDVNWALAWDIDETWEHDAPQKLRDIGKSGDYDYIDCPWLNLWDGPQHIRIDGPFASGHRVKLHNLRGSYKWVFNHPITNGPSAYASEANHYIAVTSDMLMLGKADLVCLHHGMMTPELRRFHKARWDRIYNTALRGDQHTYGFWRDAIETEDSAITVKHGYFQ